MDGLATTAAIRERERATSTHLPIIALTAHAVQGDQERCRAAGMDGYVAKPMQADDLCAAIDRLLPGGRGEKSRAEDPPLDLSDALESVGGDAVLLAELVAVLCEDYPQQVAALRQALTEDDAHRVERLGHSLHGALAAIGGRPRGPWRLRSKPGVAPPSSATPRRSSPNWSAN